MLFLSRKQDEAIMIGDNVRIVVERIGRTRVRLGIEGPIDIPIYREEVYIARCKRKEGSEPKV